MPQLMSPHFDDCDWSYVHFRSSLKTSDFLHAVTVFLASVVGDIE